MKRQFFSLAAAFVASAICLVPTVSADLPNITIRYQTA